MAGGRYKTDWKPTKFEAPEFRCRACQSDRVYYREWESDDGGYTDWQYECRSCERIWWVEGSDG